MDTEEGMPKVVLESAPCPNGCGADSEVLFTAHDRLFGLPGQFPIVRCTACGLMRTDPRPTQDTIGFFYPDDKYCAYVSTPDTTESVSVLRRFIRHAYQKIVRINSNVVPSIPPGRLLEIGCAQGSFLANMAAKNWQVEGIEVSQSVAAPVQAAGFNVFCGSLESAPDPKDRFDLIVGWMVVEHLHEPVLSLRKLARWGRPGCWLAISVPNATNIQLRLFKDRWFALQVPTHLFHFTEKSIVTMLARSGWCTDRIFHHRSLVNYSESLSYVLEDCGAPRWLTMLPRRVLMQPVIYPISCLLAALGETGLITVWAKKDADAE